MAVAFDASAGAFPQDRLSGATRANVVDRWIYVFTAATFVAVILTGFIPDSFRQIAAIQAGQRPAVPIYTHIHAILMGSFYALILGQTVLVATDKRAWHMRLGWVSAILFPALVVAGIVLVVSNYHRLWSDMTVAPTAIKQQLQGLLAFSDNVLLFQLREIIIFVPLMWIALRARTRASGLHKRLILLAAAPLLSAAFDRIFWLPTTFPGSPTASEVYTLLAVTPLFIWDLARNRTVHGAYLLFAAFYVPLTIAVHSLWDTPWWYSTAPHILGV